jgi:ubiquinone biosynthesis protein
VDEEVMANCFLHAYPHQGNFFVTPLNGQSTRPQPVIGLMDFGMVGYISDNDRLTIIQAYSLAMRDDTQGIVDLMLRVGAVSTTDDLESLERDLNRMLHTYRGLPLKHIQAGPLVNELMQMAFRYHIKLPADMWLLFKTVAMMEGLAQRLDPEFNVFAEFAPHAKRILLEQRMPWVWGATFLDDLQSLIYTARDIPSVGKSILRSFQRGEFPLAFSMGLNKETLNRLDRITTRLSLSLLATAFILGLAILLPVAQASKVAAVLVSIGFAVALVLGLWLAWSILRPGK